MRKISHKIAILGIFFLAVSLMFVLNVPTQAADEPDPDEVKEAQEDIEKYEERIKKEEAAKAKLEQSLGQIQSSLYYTQSEIKKTETLLEETQRNITRKQTEIESIDKRINFQKEILRSLLRELYYQRQESQLELLTSKKVSDLLGFNDNLEMVNERIGVLMADIAKDRKKLMQDKSSLEGSEDDHEKLIALKERQEADLLVDKQETQADIQAKEKTISQLSGKLNTLRNEYSAILGKSISTKDIVEAAAFASKATGMSKAFLLAVLIQESNKGQNTGSCDYKQSKMPSTQLTAFKKICDELDYDYKKQKVSCPPKSYKGTGGAMGVPQFMPTTWQGYKSKIASLSGHNPPDPWSLVDGVVAMASKLSNDGASKKTRFAEAKSYCVYLAGGNWGYYCYGSDKYKKSYADYNCWGSSIKNYGEKVLCLKDNYEKYY